MKRIIALLLSMLIVFTVLPAQAGTRKSSTARTTLLDTTTMTSNTSSSSEGWSYEPAGNNGSPLLTLTDYGASNAHSAPIVVPKDATIIVHGDCYIDNVFMGQKYDVLSGSYDGYLHIGGDGTLNLYANTYQGRNISLPGGGTNDNNEFLVIEDITVNCYNYERDSHHAASNEACIVGMNAVTIRNATINTYQGKCGIYSQGYTPIGGVTEETANEILIDNSIINIQNESENGLYTHALGIQMIWGKVRITGNSDVTINAGSYSIYSYLSLTIDGGKVNVRSTPAASSYYGYALVYCNDLHIGGEVEEVNFETTKWPLTVVEYCKTENASTLGEGLDLLVGTFENGDFATELDPDIGGLPALRIKKHVEIVNLLGDVDCDGSVTMADVTLLSMYLNGENPDITEQGMINANANLDGGVDIRDIAAIYAIIAYS